MEFGIFYSSDEPDAVPPMSEFCIQEKFRFFSFPAETFSPTFEQLWRRTMAMASVWNAASASSMTSSLSLSSSSLLSSLSLSSSSSLAQSRLVSSARLPFQGCYKRNFLGAKKSWKSNLILVFVKFEKFFLRHYFCRLVKSFFDFFDRIYF